MAAQREGLKILAHVTLMNKEWLLMTPQILRSGLQIQLSHTIPNQPWRNRVSDKLSPCHSLLTNTWLLVTVILLCILCYKQSGDDLKYMKGDVQAMPFVRGLSIYSFRYAWGSCTSTPGSWQVTAFLHPPTHPRDSYLHANLTPSCSKIVSSMNPRVCWSRRFLSFKHGKQAGKNT